MTDKELMSTYDINQSTVDMLRDYCNPDTLSDVDLIYHIANIKILQHRLEACGYTPDLDGCYKFVVKRQSESIVQDALRSQ